MSFRSTLNKSAVIMVFQASNGSWGSTDSFTQGQTLRCRLVSSGGREAEREGMVRAEATHRVYMEMPASDLKVRDRLMIGTRVFDIVYINNAAGGIGHHLEIDVKEVV